LFTGICQEKSERIFGFFLGVIHIKKSKCIREIMFS
jgi:hypothetical protein